MIDMNTRKASRLQITSFLCDTKILQIGEGQEYATQHRITDDTLDDNPLKVVYINECNLQGGTHGASLLTLIDCHGQKVT